MIDENERAAEQRAASSQLALAQSLCARLCHDFGGPAGTVAAMLEMAGPVDDSTEALEVAREGANLLRARLRVWRAACGGDTGPMTAADVSVMVDAMLAGGRIHFDSTLRPEAELTPPAVQLALVATLLAAEALPRGGTIHLTGTPAALMVLPHGPGARWPAGFSAAIAGITTDPDPRRLLAPFLAMLAAAEGWRLSTGFGPADMPGPISLSMG